VSPSPLDRARRYVDWLGRHAAAIIGVHAALLVASLYLIGFHLPLYADFAYLLPQDAPAVIDLHRLEARVATSDTVLVIVEAPTPADRAAATAELGPLLRALPASLVTRIDEDQAEARAFLWAHRFMLAPPEDLARGAKALRERLDAAKLAANPLYVDLDDDADRAAADRAAKDQLAELRRKRADLDRDLHRPSNVSKDERRALIEVRTAMSATEVDRGADLLDALARARVQVIAHHPGVEIGFAGDLVTAISEHDAIVSGTLISSLVTALLVGLVLALYFRSVRLLVLLVGTLGLATVVAFGTAAFTIGHLNAATAFLGAIIAGNGVNYGILLIGRFLEERRAHGVEDALAAAIVGTLRPTAVASLGAAIAYGSLAATSFKGFADFAIIGSIGMVLCWLATYGLLAVLVLRGARTAAAVQGERLLERGLVRVLGFRRPRVVLALGLAIGVGAAVIVVRYVAADPFEYDMRELGSAGPAADTERHWMAVSDAAFGRGHAGRTIIAADRLDQVPLIVAALEARARGGDLGSIVSILDVVPAHQDAQLALLSEIRTLLDDDALTELPGDELAELRELRPPDDVGPITIAMLPASIRELFAETSGRVGCLISVRPGDHLDELDGHDVIRFAQAVSHLELGDGETVTTSGASVIFADILQTIARDGPLVTALAAAGLVLMVLLVVGRDRRGLAVLVATGAGALLMVATCAVLGLKVNFLDFVALPITLGLGIDYGINVAHRQDGAADARATLRTSGAAVFVCSLTTMIGYGSLIVSDNLAIRGFGRASLIGEVTTVLAALVLVPALLARPAK
jgi:hypothetical protein